MEEYKALRGADISAASPEEFLEKIDKNQPPLSALCISGGGIRSATFALGALQGLAEQGLLKGFDYLSTVSGGGYIGSWLTAWIQRAGGLQNITPQLIGKVTPQGPHAVDPVGHLREYNNYLTPKLGFFSADTWTLVATVFRNILLNWLVLVPLLMAALMLPRVLFSFIRVAETFQRVTGSAYPIAKSPLVDWLPMISGLFIAVTIFNIARYLPGVGGRNHTQGSFLLKVLLPLILAALGYIAYDQLHYWGDQNIAKAPIGHVIGYVLGFSVAGWLAFLLFCGKPFPERVNILFGPVSMAVVLMALSTSVAAWVVSNVVSSYLDWEPYVVIALPLLILAFDLGVSIFVGLSSNALKDPDREWAARSSAWFQLFCAYWIAICALVLLVPDHALHWPRWGKSLLAGLGGASAWASRLSGLASPAAGRSDSNPGAGRLGVRFAIKAAPAIFIVIFTLGLSALTNLFLSALAPRMHRLLVYPHTKETMHATWTQHKDVLANTPLQLAVLGTLLLFLMSWIMARFINTNKFSLHSMYRNRLIRAYMGASNPNRNAGDFTGFAENDNLLMRELRTDLRPFHVVNIALNLVAGKRLDWQQRKAQSFTVSPLHSGNDELGYRPSSRYGGPDGISLGTAVTISGAAASPNMGYHSSPMTGFILTLLNARLGAWLGNTGVAGEKTWKLPGPLSATRSLVREAFGLTTNTSSYVYLSDGGHFENLGLYEMVKRGCRCIVVLDSGADPHYNYEDLGNALRKIRIDMNISIDFEDGMLQPLLKKKKRCAVATIRYSELDSQRQDGYLVYIKPLMLGNESPDVTTYSASSPQFPHESTSNQWFNESQTESYRILGRQTIREICGSGGGGLAGFRQAVEQYLAKP